MSSNKDSVWELVGPEPWRSEPLRDYDGPPPAPVEAVERELGRDAGWVVGYAVYLGRFDGELRNIPITTAMHPHVGTYQWFPIEPDRPGSGAKNTQPEER